MRRRSLLIGVVAGSAAAIPKTISPLSVARSLGHTVPDVPPMDIFQVRRHVVSANTAFRNARYAGLLTSIPALLDRLRVTHEMAAIGVKRDEYEHLLAEVYTLLSALMIKVNRNDLADEAANQAMYHAQAGASPLTYALSQRAKAIVLRRNGNNDLAQQMLLSAAKKLPTYQPGDDYKTVYSSLLATAAYTAAVNGERNTMQELMREAEHGVAQFSADQTYRHITFGPTTSDVFYISGFQAMKENTTALRYAQRVNVAQIPEVERVAQFWVYVAKSFHQTGDFSRCFQALMEVERAAPDEIRYRKPIHVMTANLLESASTASLPAVSHFARRTGLIPERYF